MLDMLQNLASGDDKKSAPGAGRAEKEVVDTTEFSTEEDANKLAAEALRAKLMVRKTCCLLLAACSLLLAPCWLLLAARCLLRAACSLRLVPCSSLFNLDSLLTGNNLLRYRATPPATRSSWLRSRGSSPVAVGRLGGE